MAEAGNVLDFEIRIKNAETEIKRLQSQFSGIGSAAQQQGSVMDRALSDPLQHATSLLTKFGVGLSATTFVKQLIDIRGEFQKTEIAFETMLGSKERAETLNKQLLDTAAKTPFDMGSITSSAKQLLAYGVAAEDVNQTLVQLGDIAAGVGSDIKDLAYLYGTTMTQGKMYTMDLRQFQGRGIGIANEIAKVMNIETDAVADAVSKGLVTADIFDKAIRNMASQGGQFYQLMEKQSASLSGQVSNLGDAVQRMMNDIGKESEGVLAGGIQAVAFLIENYKEVGGILATITAAYGVHKASVAAMSVVYNSEVEALRSVFEQKEQVIDADLREAVAKGKLTEVQALEIEKLREILPEKQKELEQTLQLQQLELDVAKEEEQIAEDMVSTAQSQIDSLVEKKDSIEEALSAAQELGDTEKVSQLLIEQSTVTENLNTAAKELNTAEELKNSATKKKTRAEITLNTTQTKLNTLETVKNTGATKAQSVAQALGAKVTKTFRAAWAALNKTMLANPLMAIVAVIAGLATAIYKVATYESDSEKATRRANEAKAEAAKEAEKEKKKLDELVKSLDNYDESSDEYKSAKQAIIDQYKDYLPNLDKEFDKLTEQGTLYETLATKITKAANAKVFFQKKEDVIANMTETVVREKGDLYEKLMDKFSEDEAKRLMSAFNNALDSNKLSFNGRAKSLDESILSQEDLDSMQGISRDAFKDIKQMIEATKNAEDEINKLKDILEIDDATASGINTNAVEEEKKKQQEEEKKRTEEYEKDLAAARKKAYDDELKLLRAKTDNKRELLKIDYEEQKKAIENERKLFLQKHNGGDTSSFDSRLKTLDAQFAFDDSQLVEEFNDSLDSIIKNNQKLVFDMEIKNLENMIDGTDDINKKLQLQLQLRDKILDRTIKQIQEQKELAIKENLGEKELQAYKSGQGSAEAKKIANAYDSQIQSEIERSSLEGNEEQLNEMAQKYKEYAEGIIEIEKWKEEEIKKINSGESGKTIKDVEAQVGIKKDSLSRKTGLTESDLDLSDLGSGFEGMNGTLFSLVDGVLARSLQNVRGYVATLQSELDRIKGETQTELDALLQEQMMLESEQAANDEAIKQAEENGNTQELNNLLEERESILGRISKNNKDINDTSKKLTTITTTQNSLYTAMDKKSDEATDPKKVVTLSDKLGIAQESLRAINDTLGIVKDAFGDTFSDAGNVALDTVMSVVTSSIAMINAISLVATGASQQLSALEKASAILTIIMVAIQIISTIVSAIVNNVSDEAKLQQAIEESKAKVEEYNNALKELEHEQDMYESKLKRSTVGEDYWKGMAKSLKSYDDQLKKSRDAEAEARDTLALAQSSEHLKDDSKKGEEAREREKEAQDALMEQEKQTEEILTQQAEAKKEIAEELMTMDLTSLSENLAESLVEGFDSGREGMSAAWDETINDMIKSMLTKQLSQELIKQLEPTFNKLSNKVAQKGDLSLDDIEAFSKEIELAKENGLKVAEAYRSAYDSLGLSLEDPDNIEGSSKGFEAMSQDTADELNGRFTALQISGAATQLSALNIETGVVQLNATNSNILRSAMLIGEQTGIIAQIAQNQLDELRTIADNTTALRETNSRLRMIEEYTSKL